MATRKVEVSRGGGKYLSASTLRGGKVECMQFQEGGQNYLSATPFVDVLFQKFRR